MFLRESLQDLFKPSLPSADYVCVWFAVLRIIGDVLFFPGFGSFIIFPHFLHVQNFMVISWRFSPPFDIRSIFPLFLSPKSFCFPYHHLIVHSLSRPHLIQTPLLASPFLSCFPFFCYHPPMLFFLSMLCDVLRRRLCVYVSYNLYLDNHEWLS